MTEPAPAAPPLRLVPSPDGTSLALDLTDSFPGPGVLVPPDRRVLERDIAAGAFPEPQDAELAAGLDRDRLTRLPAQVDAALEKAVLEGLGLLKRSGALAEGRDAVLRAVRDGAADTVLVAGDAGPRAAQVVGRLESLAPPPLILAGPGAHAAGAALGRDRLVFAGFGRARAGQALMARLLQLAAFRARAVPSWRTGCGQDMKENEK